MTEQQASRILPTGEQIKRFATDTSDGPIVMLNLLKFRERATYANGSDTVSGREAYERYGAIAARKIAALGGNVVYMGQARGVLIGDDDENDWDEVLLVRYPSRTVFADMLRDPEYLAAHEHRTAGLERTVLIETRPTLVPAAEGTPA